MVKSQRLICYDFFKFVAILVMIIDHVGKYFLPEIEILRVIGRVAAPLFFFLVGYSKSQRLEHKILIYAVLLQ